METTEMNKLDAVLTEMCVDDLMEDVK
nr:MAG: hypothetical protein [Bacteriophage sp.]